MSFSASLSNPSSGSRRLTLTMLAVREQADRFKGAAPGSAKPLRYLAAFQEAEPYLGLPPQAYKLVAWLVKQTMACDWEEGSRPICWPSAARQAEFLGLSPARVKVLNRALYEAGIFIVRDSETGKRYGRRGPDGQIIEAYGFDLSPLAYRFDEFIRIAAEAKAERDRVRGLRKRITLARRAIWQAGETLAALAPLPPSWAQLESDTAQLVVAARAARVSQDLALIARSLEGRQVEAESLLKQASKPVETSPEGLENKPHTISTNKPSDPKDTVIASEKSSPGEAALPTPCPSERASEADLGAGVDFKPFERVEKLHPGELLELAPRLAAHVPQQYPDWGEIVDAAGAYLAVELGVSPSLWGEACRALGRPVAAIALAVVSTKPKEHFTRGAGGYFAAMVKRGQKGELHLDRSLWALRRDRWGSKSDYDNARKAQAVTPKGGWGELREAWDNF
jgi:replication initiation protein RepC